MMITPTILTCPECNSQDILHDQPKGEMICKQCGIVVSEHELDRKHAPFSIDELNRLNALGNKSTCINARLKKVLKYNKQLDWTTKSKLISAREIERVSIVLNIPEYARELAKKVYSRAKDHGLIVGHSIKGMALGALYYACRFHQIAYSLEKLAKISSHKKQEIKNCFVKLVRELGLKCPPRDITSSVHQYANLFQLKHKTKLKAVKIIKLYQKNYTMSGKSPKGIIAAAIYYAVSLSNSNFLSQKAIARKMKISAVTLRARFKQMMELKKKLKLEVMNSVSGLAIA